MAEIGLSYGAHERQSIDVFHPDPPAATRAIVMIVHGGYWRSFSPAVFSHWARGMNARGYVAALPGYRLCPEVTVADIVADIRSAALFLHRLYGRPIVVCGHSAGGHLAAALLALGLEGAPAAVGSGLFISGLFDLAPLLSTSVNTQIRLDEAGAAALSPAFWPVPSAVRCIAMVGAEESSEYLRQSRLLAERWSKQGANAAFETIAGANHFTAPAGLADPHSDLVAKLTALAADT